MCEVGGGLCADFIHDSLMWGIDVVTADGRLPKGRQSQISCKGRDTYTMGVVGGGLRADFIHDRSILGIMVAAEGHLRYLGALRPIIYDHYTSPIYTANVKLLLKTIHMAGDVRGKLDCACACVSGMGFLRAQELRSAW